MLTCWGWRAAECEDGKQHFQRRRGGRRELELKFTIGWMLSALCWWHAPMSCEGCKSTDASIQVDGASYSRQTPTVMTVKAFGSWPLGSWASHLDAHSWICTWEKKPLSTTALLWWYLIGNYTVLGKLVWNNRADVMKPTRRSFWKLRKNSKTDVQCCRYCEKAELGFVGSLENSVSNLKKKNPRTPLLRAMMGTLIPFLNCEFRESLFSCKKNILLVSTINGVAVPSNPAGAQGFLSNSEAVQGPTWALFRHVCAYFA